MLSLLNGPVAKILVVHIRGHKAKKANSVIAKGFKAQLLLAKGV